MEKMKFGILVIDDDPADVENISHTWYILLNCTLLIWRWNWALRINSI